MATPLLRALLLLILTASAEPCWAAAPPAAKESLPKGTLLRLNHRAGIKAILFAPTGRSLASVDQTGELRLWRMPDGKPIEPFAGLAPLRVLRFWFHPDGRACIAIDVHGGIHIRDLASGRLLRRLPPFTAKAVSAWFDAADCGPNEFLLRKGPVVLSPNARAVAFLGEDSRAHVYDLGKGKVQRLAVTLGRDSNLVFSADSRLLAIRNGPQHLSVWDLQTGKCVCQPILRGNCWSRPCFSPDGRTLAWSENASPRQGLVCLFDLVKRGTIGVLRGEAAVNEEGVAFSADGHFLAVPMPKAVYVWEIRGQRLARLLRHTGDTVDLRSTRSAFMIARLGALRFKRRRLVDLLSGRVLHRLKDEPGIAQAWVVSPEGRMLAVMEKEIVFRELLSGGEVARLPTGHRGRLQVLAFSPDGRFLATGGSEGSVHMRDWKRACGLTSRRGGRLDAHRLRVLWQTLASADAGDACRAMGTLIAHPRQTETLLERILPVVNAEEGQLFRRLVDDLDSDDFAVRESAQKRLTQWSREWAPLLRKVLDGKPSLEVRYRIAKILTAVDDRDWSAAMRQRLRAVQVLEEIGTPAARRILQAVAKGEPAAPLTQHARAAGQRLSHGAAASKDR